MPDPKNPTPVRVEARGGKFVVVDADGKKLPGTEAFEDSAKAAGVAERVNASWKRAKEERKSKGAPAVTESAMLGAVAGGGGLGSMRRWDPVKHPRKGGKFARSLRPGQSIELAGSSVSIHRTETGELAVRHGYNDHSVHTDPEKAAASARDLHAKIVARSRPHLHEALAELEERAWPLTGGAELHLKFDPRLHRRDRLGRFVETLRKLQFAQHGSTVELPHNVRVRTHLGAFEVSSGSGTVRLRSMHAAAAQALTHVDDADVARGGDANRLHPARMDELKAARRGAMVEPYSGVLHIDGLIKQERKAHEARNPPVPFYNRHGRTAQTKAYWKSRIHVDAKTGAQNLERALAQLRTG